MGIQIWLKKIIAPDPNIKQNIDKFHENKNNFVFGHGFLNF